jgi:hypothetical protein
MPLLDLKTNLKDLKYGQDRPGGGDSRQPYIKTDINTVDTGFNRLRLTKFDDGLVRGGIIGALNASVVDTLRIGKFFIDAPKGPLFIIKQVGLQLTNPRLEIPKNPANIAAGAPSNILSVGTNGLLQPTRIYNLGINTLLQVPINALGGHIVRHGLLPIQSDASKYEAIVTANNDSFSLNDPSKNNRLVGLISELGLKKFKINPLKQPTTLTAEGSSLIARGNGIDGEIRRLSEVVVEGIKSKLELGGVISSLSYTGGPGSVYGIGYTNIRRSIITNPSSKEAKDDAKIYTTNLSRILNEDNSERVTKADIGLSANDSRIRKFVDNTLSDYNPDNASNIRDFTAVNYTSVQPSLRKYSELIAAINNVASSSKTDLKNYGIVDTNNLQESNTFNNSLSAANVSTRRNPSSTGYSTSPKPEIVYFNGILDANGSYETVTLKTKGSWHTISREQRVGSGRKDLINLTPLFDEAKYFGNDKIGTHNIRDLVKFRIQAVDTDSPNKGKWMIFRAYLTDLSDDNSAEWSDVKYAGRGDKFYIYTGFTRKINISFKVAALSADEMKFIYQRLNFLMSNTMPDYSNELMRGPLIRMTVGNWVDSQLGILNSVNFKIPQDSPWEIALDEPEGGSAADKLILPHIVEVSLSFTPIGSETRANNLISKKSETTSHIAQNNTGDISKQYIG